MKIRTSIVSALVAITLLAIPTTSSAREESGYYCGVLLNPDTWCSAVLKRYTYNAAFYSGQGTVRVGIRQVLTDGSLWNRKFADNWVATNSTAAYSYAQVANASSNRHTIGGLARFLNSSSSTGSDKRFKGRVKKRLRAAYAEPARKIERATYYGGIAEDGRLCVRRATALESTESCDWRRDGDVATVVVTEDSTRDLERGQVRIFGRVADGVTAVSITLGKAKPVVVDAENGVFELVTVGNAGTVPVIANAS